MAGNGARAAGRPRAADRRARHAAGGRSGLAGAPSSIPAGAAGIGLGRRPQCPDRVPVGRRQYRASTPAHSEMVALAPEVILANGTSVVAPLLQATRTLPVVFGTVVDPVGAGFVASLARPGGNATGVTAFEYGMSGKWPELLRQIAPHTTRAAVLRGRSVASGSAQFGAIQAVGPLLGVEVSPIDVRDAGEIERAVTEFARSPNGGLIMTGSAAGIRQRDLVVALAARHRLPSVYPYVHFVTGGGPVSYGPDYVDPFRRATSSLERVPK